MRAVLDAIFYIIETGCQWRMIPKDFPTDNRAPLGFAPLAIGLGLTLIHLVSIPGAVAKTGEHGKGHQ
jgi:hypothetical protein